MDPVADIARRFEVSGRLAVVRPLGSGNVNDTYLAVFRTTFDERRIVLQRINRRVFRRPETIAENLRAITAHILPKLEREADAADRIWQLPAIVPTRDGHDGWTDGEGQMWRALTLIDSSRAFDSAQGPDHARECGCVLGQFHRLLADLDAARLGRPLPGFHVTPLYLDAYDATLDSPGAAARIDAAPGAARESMRFVAARRDAAGALQRAHESGALRSRPIHGDPKVNNIMIDDDTGRGVAIVDLDTVGPGLLPHDVGDALRSIANPAGEEVADPGLVRFDMDLCSAFCSGYFRFAGESLDEAERAGLFDAVRILPFELGLRFFEDYLHGDIYFKVRRPTHNLDRARVQFRLCELIETAERDIRRALGA